MLDLGSMYFHLGANTKGLNLADRETKKFVKNTKKQLKQVDKSTAKTAKGFKNMGFAITAVAAATALALKKAVTLADEYNILQQRIKAATSATGDYTEVSEELYAISQRTGTALAGNVSLFQTLARTAPELGAVNSQMLTLTETLGQLGVIGGSSTEQMRNGLLQFSQAMAGGIFRAEEMNSILENTPEIAARIAKGMGLTVGQLRLATLEGKILSQDVFDSLQKQAAGIAREFALMPLTISRTSVALANSVQQFVGKLDEATGITLAIAQALKTAADYLDSVDVDAFVFGMERAAYYLGVVALVNMQPLVRSMWALTVATAASGKALKRSGWGLLLIGLSELIIFVAESKKGVDDMAKSIVTSEHAMAKAALEAAKMKAEFGDFTVGDETRDLTGDWRARNKKEGAELVIILQKQIDAFQAVADAAVAAKRAMRGVGHFEPAVRNDAEKGERGRMAEAARNALADQMEAAQKAAKARRKSTEKTLAALTKGLMTDRELHLLNYKQKWADLKQAEEDNITTLIPYAEIRKRMAEQEAADYAELLKKRTEALRNSLNDIAESLMSESDLLKKHHKETNDTLKRGRDKGILSLTEYNKQKEQIAAKHVAALAAIGGGGDTKDEHNIEAIRDSFMTQAQIETAFHADRMERLIAAQGLEFANKAEFNRVIEQEQQRHTDALAEIDKVHLKGVNTLKYLFGKADIRLSKENATEQEKADEKAFYKQVGLAEGHSKTLFNLQKSLAVAQALIDAPAAILSSFKHGSTLGGPTLGYIYAGIAAAATATQVAAISSAQFTASKAVGGNVFAGGMYRIAEQGPEIVTIGNDSVLAMGNKSGTITPNHKLGGGGGNVTVNVYPINGETARISERQTDDGVQIDILMEQVDQHIASGISNGDSATSQILESQFNLNRANGS